MSNSGKYTLPVGSLFNGGPDKFRHFRAALGKAQAGIGICRIAHVGDSTTEGVGISTATARMQGSYPGQLAQLLSSTYTLDGSHGFLQTFTNNGGYWPEYTTTGTFSQLGLVPFQLGNSAATLTYQSADTGTVIDFYYLNSSASFTYSVDGAAAVTVTPPGGSGITLVQITGLANATHKIVFTANNNTMQILTVLLHNSTTSGIQFWNAGIGSSKTTDWFNSNWYCGSKLVADWNPNLTIIQIGINDATNQTVSPSAYSANVQSMITTAQANGDVMLITPVPAGGVDFSQYLPLLYQLASTNNIPLLDMFNRWKDQTTENGYGIYSDSYHPNQAGYNDEAHAVYNAIMS